VISALKTAGLMAACLLAGLAQPAFGQSETLHFGALYNLTGQQKGLDLPSLQGAMLRAQEERKKGRSLQLLSFNGQSSTERVADGTKALFARAPNVLAIFGYSDSDMVLASAPIAGKEGRVFLTSGATSPKLPSEVPEWLFLVCFSDNVQAAAGADYATATLGAKTVAIIYDDTETYTKLLAGYFKSAFAHGGGQVVSDTAIQDTASLQSAVTALPKADLYYLALEAPDDIVAAVEAVRKAGDRTPIMGGDSYDSTSLWAEADWPEKVFYSTHVYLGADNPDPEVQAFLTAYNAAYTTGAPNAFAALGYDALGLLLNAVARAGSRDPEAIRKALSETSGYEGVTGRISYENGSRIPTKPVALITVEGGKKKLAAEITPGWVPAP